MFKFFYRLFIINIILGTLGAIVYMFAAFAVKVLIVSSTANMLLNVSGIFTLINVCMMLVDTLMMLMTGIEDE